VIVVVVSLGVGAFVVGRGLGGGILAFCLGVEREEGGGVIHMEGWRIQMRVLSGNKIL